MWSEVQQVPAQYVTGLATIVAALIGLKKSGGGGARSFTNAGGGVITYNDYSSAKSQATAAWVVCIVLLLTTVGLVLRPAPVAQAQPSDDAVEAQNFLNSYYAADQRYSLADVSFDDEYFNFPLQWYEHHPRYTSADDFAAPKRAYLERAKAKGWPICGSFAPKLANVVDGGDPLIVTASVTPTSSDGCKGGSPSIVEYHLSRTPAGVHRFKISEVRDQ